jgi:hypothetical protein
MELSMVNKAGKVGGLIYYHLKSQIEIGKWLFEL